MSDELRSLRSVFSDIVKSYSFLGDSPFGPISIKHLGNLELAEIDYFYNLTLNDAIKKGIPNYESKVESLVEDGLWSRDDETKISEYKETASQYESNRDSQFLKSKRAMWAKELANIKDEIYNLELRKQSILGDYAEGFATKRSNEMHILLSFYSGADITKRLFSQESFNQLDDAEIKSLFTIFQGYTDKFNQGSIKKIALSNFFLNMFSLTSENIYEFYGKPVVNLTFYQIDLFGWGKHFKQILSQFGSKIPPNIMDDPNKILEYVELNKNYQEAFPEEGGEGGGMSLMGASKEDYEVLGIKAEGNKKFADALKKKGKLSLDDIMKLSGE